MKKTKFFITKHSFLYWTECTVLTPPPLLCFGLL